MQFILHAFYIYHVHYINNSEFKISEYHLFSIDVKSTYFEI